MIVVIIHFILWVLFAYVAINVLYLFIYALVGRFRSSRRFTAHPEKKKIAVLIPSYKEDEIILHTARAARTHDYPADKFDIFLAADQLKPETIQELRAIPVHVLEVSFEIGSKARSLNKLLNSITGDYEIGIILDADNIMMPGCLEKVNAAFQAGYRAVQCHRIAKNRNTPVAVLDAMSEEVNNHFFRKSMRAMGFSSTVIGSGMAFEFEKIRTIYNKPGILGNPACDREVDFEIMKSNIVIEYLEEAYVMDEKVSSKAVYERQRTRWLESQIIHLKLFFDRQQQGFRKDKNYWNKLFLNLIPPRLIFLAFFTLVLFLAAVQYLSGITILYPDQQWWLLLTALYLLTFLIAIPPGFYKRDTFLAFLHIPGLMLSMLKAVFKMKVSRKEFLHTPKTFTQKPQQ